MALDLSAIGVPSPVPVEHRGGGQYTGSTTITVPRNGQYYVPVLVEMTEEGDWCPLYTATLDVYPLDLSIYEDGPGEGWTVQAVGGESDPGSSAFVRSGSSSHAISLPKGGQVKYVLDDPQGIGLLQLPDVSLRIRHSRSPSV